MARKKSKYHSAYRWHIAMRKINGKMRKCKVRKVGKGKYQVRVLHKARKK